MDYAGKNEQRGKDDEAGGLKQGAWLGQRQRQGAKEDQQLLGRGKVEAFTPVESWQDNHRTDTDMLIPESFTRDI